MTTQQDFATIEKKTARINIIVDAHGIFSNLEPGQDAKEYCSVSDNQGSPPRSGSGIKTFTTDVFKANKVHWRADVYEDSEEFTFEFLGIDIPGNGCQMLVDIKIPPGNKERMSAKVKNVSEVVGCLENYILNFRLTNAGGESKEFILDPFVLGNP